MNRQSLETIQQNEDNIDSGKNFNIRRKKSKTIRQIQKITNGLQKQELREIIMQLQSKINDIDKPIIRKTNSVLSINLFSVQSQQNSPRTDPFDQLNGQINTFSFNKMSSSLNPLQQNRRLQRNKQSPLRLSSLSQKRGIIRNVSVPNISNKYSPRNELVSPSFKKSLNIKQKQQFKTSKKTNPFIGVQNVQQNDYLKKLSQQYALKSENQQLIPVIVGILGLLLMLIIYLY